MTHYYFIRHAEKDRLSGTSDPHLTQEGKKRARRWADFFADKDIGQIYCTHLKRTRETAAPTARYFNLNIKTYQGIFGFIEKFKKETRGENVLIVGHQDTTPHFVNSLLGKEKYSMITSGQHGKVFHLVLDEDGKIAKEEVWGVG